MCSGSEVEGMVKEDMWQLRPQRSAGCRKLQNSHGLHWQQIQISQSSEHTDKIQRNTSQLKQSWTGSSSQLKPNEGLAPLISLLFVCRARQRACPRGLPARVTSGKTKRGQGGHRWGTCHSCSLTPSRPDSSCFCFPGFVFIPPSSFTHSHTPHCPFLLPSARGLISIPLKDQESTRPGKCYPDKQNSKYLHPQG